MITVNSLFTLEDGSQELTDNVESSGNYLAVIDIGNRKVILNVYQDGTGEISVYDKNLTIDREQQLLKSFHTLWDNHAL